MRTGYEKYLAIPSPYDNHDPSPQDLIPYKTEAARSYSGILIHSKDCVYTKEREIRSSGLGGLIKRRI